jgi:hypothetical protein
MPIVGSFAGASARAYGLGAGGVPIVGDFESIQTITAGSAVANIEFTSIPATYTHLQIRFIARTSQAGDVTGGFLSWTYNNDTAANYTYHVVKSDGVNATAANIINANNTFGERITTAFQTASSFGVGYIDVLDYANTNKFKTHIILAGWDSNGSGQVAFNSGLWRSTSAISSIKILPSGASNFVQYSSFALYGVKA